MKILESISNVLGGNLFGGIKDIISQFKISPQEALEMEQKTKELIFKHEADLKNIALQEMQSQQKENENARNREIELSKTKNAIGVYVMNGAAALIVLAFFVTSFLPYFFAINEANKNIIELANARVTDATILILGYWFGSSLGSSKKQEKLNNLIN